MSRYLEMVDHPTHVKKLTLDQCVQLAAEVREELITKLAKHGGHLGPNLGVVELTGLVGYYVLVAMGLNAHQHPLPEGKRDRGLGLLGVNHRPFDVGERVRGEVPPLDEEDAPTGRLEVVVHGDGQGGETRPLDPAMRQTPFQAFVRTQTGCDKFCVRTNA
mgnify:CR=1 FL=1